MNKMKNKKESYHQGGSSLFVFEIRIHTMLNNKQSKYNNRKNVQRFVENSMYRGFFH